MKRGDLRDKLEALLRGAGASFGSDALAGDIVDLIERGGALRLEPESPAERELPARLWLSPRILENPLPGQPKGWFVRSTAGGPAILAVFRHGGWPLEEDRAERLITAALAAYNEREEIDVEVEAGVKAERERCAAILGDLAKGFETIDYFASAKMARAARRKVESGEEFAPVWTGEDDHPNQEPTTEPGDGTPEARLHFLLRGLAERFPRIRATQAPELTYLHAIDGLLSAKAAKLLALLNSENPPEGFIDAVYDHSVQDETDAGAAWRWLREQVHGPTVEQAPAPEPSREFPERLDVQPAKPMPVLWPPGGYWGTYDATLAAYQEAARRWEAEPKLRAEIGALKAEVKEKDDWYSEHRDRANALRDRLNRVSLVIGRARSILAGKEESHG